MASPRIIRMDAAEAEKRGRLDGGQREAMLYRADPQVSSSWLREANSMNFPGLSGFAFT